jgi:hypothetical protein
MIKVVIVALNINQNIPVDPVPSGEAPARERQPDIVLTELVNRLKAECDEKERTSPKTNQMRSILVAVGISLLVLESVFLGAAFIMSSLLFGKIGMSILSVSFLPFAAILLFNPVDYAEAKGKVDEDLLEFAQKDKIQLTPDNVIMYRAIYDLTKRREAEEAKQKAEKEKNSSQESQQESETVELPESSPLPNNC